ncbi:glycoside hydrolase family 28 protein [Ramaria rubella]|nr:glycoside hydrolase family 28 protein [Ramaria rubella]
MILRLTTIVLSAFFFLKGVHGETCTLKPLGQGKDDTTQVLNAIAKCGHSGHTIFTPGNYNITRKMTWDLQSATIDLHGVLNFQPDIQFWLQSQNTYRVIFIQSQASWFVITGKDFVVDAHNTGGIQGNGQPWWDFFLTDEPRDDGDGRPVALTLSHVARGAIMNFKIDSPPFWCNAVADSQDVVYQGMTCNATNTNPVFAGQNLVWNTDGIDTYRADNISLIDWDVTTGDDCIAIKGNSTDIYGKNIMCRGGEGIAIGSLGQYQQFDDNVENVYFENITTQKPPLSVQPNMVHGIYVKTWSGSVHGSPPTGGGGGGGKVNNLTVKGLFNDDVGVAVQIITNNGGQPGDLPSKLKLSDLTFIDFTGTTNSSQLVDLECSAAFPCSNIRFENFKVQSPPNFVCVNTINESGLPAPCVSGGI